jgi:hypothetical protein
MAPPMACIFVGNVYLSLHTVSQVEFWGKYEGLHARHKHKMARAPSSPDGLHAPAPNWNQVTRIDAVNWTMAIEYMEYNIKALRYYSLKEGEANRIGVVV